MEKRIDGPFALGFVTTPSEFTDLNPLYITVNVNPSAVLADVLNQAMRVSCLLNVQVEFTFNGNQFSVKYPTYVASWGPTDSFGMSGVRQTWQRIGTGWQVVPRQNFPQKT